MFSSYPCEIPLVSLVYSHFSKTPVWGTGRKFILPVGVNECVCMDGHHIQFVFLSRAQCSQFYTEQNKVTSEDE